MTTLYLATAAGPLVLEGQGDAWRTHHAAEVGAVSSVAVDPGSPGRAFWGSERSGVWRSDGRGRTWRHVAEELPHRRVTAVATGAGPGADRSVVYVGTEPSRVYRSDDAGATWRECRGLSDLPSADEWSFPPRPDTHHVRWIEADPCTPGGLHVAIEAGALVHSPDGGESWRDRRPDGPYDTHQLATHPAAPGRLWSAAGDGFFESDDCGASWRQAEEGLRFRYCWSVAVDAGDAGNLVLAAAPGPREAHSAEHAESALFRRAGDGPWREVRDGLPEPGDSRAPVVAADRDAPGTFYAATDAGLFRSADGGARWQHLDVDGLDEVAGARAHAVVVAPSAGDGG